MLRLLVEASGAEAWVGLAEGEQLLAQARSRVRAGHGEALLPLIVECMAERAPSALEQVVVGVGPGSFTGVRVALATALGLRRALGVPIVTVTSFEMLAALEPSDAPRLLLVSALPGEFYAQAWRTQAVGEPAVVLHEELEAFAEARLGLHAQQVQGEPTLSAMVRAAHGKPPVEQPEPVYVAPPKISLPRSTS